MPEADKWKLIQRYIARQCSADERAEIESWMAEDPANRKLVEDLEQIWSMTPEEDFEVNPEDAWDRFRVREMSRTISGRRKEGPPPANSRILTVFRAAAAILLVAFVGFFSWQFLNEQEAGSPQAYHEPMQEIKTQKGEKAQVSFSDGTVVTLNAAGSLRYPKQFNGPRREVYLKGEAYFEVASHADHPFVVYTNTAEVEVLGTKFNVRAWEEDTAVDVGVRDGKVAVSSADSTSQKEGVVLTRGQYTKVIKGRGVTGVRDVDVDKHLLWLNGGMYFDNEPFSKVVRQIERRFDVQIAVADAQLLDVPFTGEFQRAELEEVLNVISVSMGIEYSQEGFDITFNLPGSNR